MSVARLMAIEAKRGSNKPMTWIPPNVAMIGKTSRLKSCNGGHGRSHQQGAHNAS
jgi:hypothetical protein